MTVLRFRKNASGEVDRLMAAFSPAATEDPETLALASDAKWLARLIDNPEHSITNNELRSCFVRAAGALHAQDIPDDRRKAASAVMHTGLTYKTGMQDVNIVLGMCRCIEIEQELEKWSGYGPTPDMPQPLSELRGGNDEAEVILEGEKNTRKACLYSLLDIGALVIDEGMRAPRITPVGIALMNAMAKEREASMRRAGIAEYAARDMGRPGIA